MNTLKSKKFWWIFIFNVSLVILLFAIGVFIGIIIRNKQLIDQEILTGARSHFQNIVLTRRWNSNYNGIYVEKIEGVESNPYLDNPDITGADGKVYTKKNPALMTREISELAEKQGLYTFHITSSKPLNPNNEPDEFESYALNLFEQGTTEFYEKVNFDGKTYFRYMAPLSTEESCLSCHAKQGYKVGSV